MIAFAWPRACERDILSKAAFFAMLSLCRMPRLGGEECRAAVLKFVRLSERDGRQRS